MKVFLQRYESVDMSAIDRTNTLIKESKSRIIDDFIGNRGRVSWKDDLGAVKWI
jgi:hypothetical protein